MKRKRSNHFRYEGFSNYILDIFDDAQDFETTISSYTLEVFPHYFIT